MNTQSYSKDDGPRHFWKIMAGASEAHASDVHFEQGAVSAPGPTVTVRYRINGQLEDPIEELPLPLYEEMAAYLSEIAGLDVSAPGGRGKPWSAMVAAGRFSDIDARLRCSIIPTLGGGHDIAIRILAGDLPIPLDHLGWGRFERNAVKQVPYGLVLFSGPAGSGRLTSLSSMLYDIKQNDKLKVLSICEDQPEMFAHLNPLDATPGSGISYEDWMRFARQTDADVLYAGSLKGPEKLPAAVDVALDGFTVMADLHANSACEAIVRYMDWCTEVDRRSSVDALATVVCQRLMKRLCRECSVRVRLEQDEIKNWLLAYCTQPGNPEDVPKTEQLKATYERWLRTYADETGALYRHEPAGCSKCNGTGYRGRVAIPEAVVVTREMRKLLLSGTDEAAILKLAMKGGTSTLRQNAIEKALIGTVDFNHIDGISS